MVQISGKVARKLKFLGQLRAKLKKFIAKDHFVKDAKLWGFNWLSLGVKLNKIKSLMVNWESNCINLGPRINVKKTIKFRNDIEVQ